VLANELYRVAFIDPDSPLNERVVEFLRVLRLTDLDMYYRLMQEAMWAEESEVEEWAYRWRTGRLQDEGIPDYYEALEAYHVIEVGPLYALSPGLLEPPGVLPVLRSQGASQVMLGALLRRARCWPRLSMEILHRRPGSVCAGRWYHCAIKLSYLIRSILPTLRPCGPAWDAYMRM